MAEILAINWLYFSVFCYTCIYEWCLFKFKMFLVFFLQNITRALLILFSCWMVLFLLFLFVNQIKWRERKTVSGPVVLTNILALQTWCWNTVLSSYFIIKLNLFLMYYMTTVFNCCGLWLVYLSNVFLTQSARNPVWLIISVHNSWYLYDWMSGYCLTTYMLMQKKTG